MVQGLHFWWIWLLKVPFGQVLQEPEQRIGLDPVPILDSSHHWLVETYDSLWAPGLCRTCQCKSCTCHRRTWGLLCSRTQCLTKGCILSTGFGLLDTAGPLQIRDWVNFRLRKWNAVNRVPRLTYALCALLALEICRTFCVPIGPARSTKVLWPRPTLLDQAVSYDKQTRCMMQMKDVPFFCHTVKWNVWQGTMRALLGKSPFKNNSSAVRLLKALINMQIILTSLLFVVVLTEKRLKLYLASSYHCGGNNSCLGCDSFILHIYTV